jgi:hypothetical protein
MSPDLEAQGDSISLAEQSNSKAAVGLGVSRDGCYNMDRICQCHPYRQPVCEISINNTLHARLHEIISIITNKNLCLQKLASPIQI